VAAETADKMSDLSLSSLQEGESDIYKLRNELTEKDGTIKELLQRIEDLDK